MKISIVTVCLNSERTIEQTIQSVVNQKYPDIEYIVVDGGSTDGTLEIIAKYREKIAVFVSEPDEGIYDAMNKGIVLATGDVIGIINSDDWYEDGVFAYVSRQFDDGETQVLYANANMIDNNKIVGKWEYTPIENLMREMVIPHPTVFVKKEIYTRHGGFDTQYKISADYDLMLRLYVDGVRFKHCDKTFANFRCNGISQQNIELTKRDGIKIVEKHLSRIDDDRREKWLPIAVHNYSWDLLILTLGQKLKGLIASNLFEGQPIAVWGAGKGGRLMCEILCENNYAPEFVVDNNPQCWDTYLKGIKIVEPERLNNFCGYVFIMVKLHSQEIAEFVKKMSNSNLMVVRWEEL